MSGAAVTVARLALTAPDPGRALGFRNDLEDALRTASLTRLPAGARLSVRRLRLGRLPAGLTRQALSRRIEALLDGLAPELAQPGRPVPPSADAVVVPDAVAAAALALDALAAGQALPWYLEPWFPDLPPGAEGPAAVVEALVARVGPAGPGRLAEARDGAERLLRLAASLSPDAVRRALARACGSGTSAGGAADAAGHRSEGHPAAAWPRSPQALLLRVATPAAVRGLAAAASPLPPPGPRLALLAAWLAAARGGTDAARRAVEALTTGCAEVAPARLSVEARDAGGPATSVAAAPDQTAAAPAAPAPPCGSDRAAAAVAVHPPPSRGWWPADAAALAEGAPCRHAGLWLLLAPLRLVGAEAAEAATGAPVARALMARFADRLGIAEDDPLRAGLEPAGPVALAPDPWMADPTILGFVAGGRRLKVARHAPARAALLARPGIAWACLDAAGLRRLRRAGPCLGAAASRAGGPPLLPGLSLAVQRLVFRATGQGWRRLVARPGRVTLTATHLDITFDGRDADPAARMAGFDFDPGWVPWLGRVVSFRYDYSQALRQSGPLP